MIKNNKFKFIISVIITLLPVLAGIIFWDKLPDNMVTHIGMDGTPDGLSSKLVTILVLPLILLVLHIVLLAITPLIDKNMQDQNKKVLSTVFWIIPIISLFINGLMYSIAFGKTASIEIIMAVLFGLLFIFLGNYLPKAKQNRTYGIKIYFTLNNEENWNKTHRFGGKIWVICGLIIIFSALLPTKFMIPTFIIVLFASILIPIIYSYGIYRKHKKEGIKYTSSEKTKSEKTAVTVTLFIIPLILLGTAVLMFTGNIEYEIDDDSFTVEADYFDDLTVSYSDIDTIEYREVFKNGFRKYGFASARLSMGTFGNDEYSSYVLYSYTGVGARIIISIDGETLVLGAKTDEETKTIYESIAERCQVKNQ